jgi:hypothetical protein
MENSGQWLRAFSSGFNQLTKVIHSENARKIKMVCTMESENFRVSTEAVNNASTFCHLQVLLADLSHHCCLARKCYFL